jgi:SAM-dependent methyltransferase
MASGRLVSIVKSLVPGPLRPFAKRVHRVLIRQWASRVVEPRERAYARKMGLAALPPAELRFRVAGETDVESFVRVARRCSEDVEAALQRIGRSLESFENLLDFGCGCGRCLLQLAGRAGLPKCYGTDVDTEAIAWCQRNLSFGEFAANEPTPPLPFPSEMFDLILAVSVFTHLDEDNQARWLEELKRVARPGAVLLCTVHGAHIWRNLPGDFREEVERDGFLFVSSAYWKGTFPDWYQTSYQTEQYVRRTFGARFQVVDYLPRGLVDHQDMVILRKA